MIKETRPAYYAAKRNAEWCGKSTDTLPKEIANGDEFYAIDEGKWYVYDGTTNSLVEDTTRGGGGGGGTTDISLGITGATVGQIIKIATVDENGAPTSWQVDSAISGIYGSQFYLYDVSPSSVGEKLLANSSLTCVPSTNSVARQDDYATLPLFACYDVNYTIDAETLEPVIHAIKGIYGNFSKTPEDSLVGVIQMTGWVKRFKDNTHKTIYYAAFNQDGTYRPLPEAVKVDNTVRSYVLHAKYTAGFNKGGKLSSISGVQPASYRPGDNATSMSHNNQIALWKQWGDQYCGSSILDMAFLQTMVEIKYAQLSARGIG